LILKKRKYLKIIHVNDKTPISHASSETAYGVGTSSNYGHVKLSSSTASTSGQDGGTAATPSAVKAAYDLANTANETANGKAPTSHASSGTTYGTGNGTNYGHLRLSDATNSTSSIGGGYAATPKSVKEAYDRASTGITNAATAQSTADTAKTNADNAQSTANSALTKANAAMPKANFSFDSDTGTLNITL